MRQPAHTFLFTPRACIGMRSDICTDVCIGTRVTATVPSPQASRSPNELRLLTRVQHHASPENGPLRSGHSTTEVSTRRTLVMMGRATLRTALSFSDGMCARQERRKGAATVA